jgi:hypothetical protein
MNAGQGDGNGGGGVVHEETVMSERPNPEPTDPRGHEEPSATRAPYEPPRLVRLGTVRDLTWGGSAGRRGDVGTRRV